MLVIGSQDHPVLHKGPSEASVMLCGSVHFNLLFHDIIDSELEGSLWRYLGFNLFSFIVLESLLQMIFLHDNSMQETDRNGVPLGNLLQKLEISEEPFKCNDLFQSPRMCKPQVYCVQGSEHRPD